MNDNLILEVDVVVYWWIMEIERVYYVIENVESVI